MELTLKNPWVSGNGHLLLGRVACVLVKLLQHLSIIKLQCCWKGQGNSHQGTQVFENQTTFLRCFGVGELQSLQSRTRPVDLAVAGSTTELRAPRLEGGTSAAHVALFRAF